MKFRIFIAEQDGYRYKIEEDYPEVGAYLYILKENECIEDYLQNNIETCKQFAFEEYGVTIDKWTEVDH